jgi:hypothetical protein
VRIDSTGAVGIGTTSPSQLLTLDVASAANGIRIFSTGAGSGGTPIFEGIGYRADGNTTFGTRFGAAFRRSDGTAIASGQNLGYYTFGGQHGTATTFTAANVRYPASITGVAEGSFTNASTMPTGISFRTGSVGDDLYAVNQTYGTERMRITSSGLVGIGRTPTSRTLEVASSIGILAPALTSARIDLFSNGQTASEFTIGQGAFASTDNIAYVWNRANAAMVFATNNVERVRIDSAGAVNIPTAPGTNPGLLNVRSADLGGTATNTSTIATMRVASGNEDKIIFDAVRNTTGANWDTASLRVRRMVDASNHNFLEFANNGTYIGWGANRRVAIYDGNNNAMDILGKMNLTSALGTSRSTIDWGVTQSGLTIWNTDNTPLSLGTTGTNRMTISAAGDTSFLGNVNIDANTLSFGSTGRQMINLWGTAHAIGIQSNTTYFRAGSGGRFSWFLGGVHSASEDDPGAGGSRVMTMASTGIIVGSNTVQTDGTIRTRRNGNNIEWGHTNTAGYHATLGAEVGTGAPFIALGAEAGTNSNTYRTRGRGATILRGDNGAFSISTLASTNADNQSLVDRFGIDSTIVYVKHASGDRRHMFRDGYLDTANLANSAWAVFDARATAYNFRDAAGTVLLGTNGNGTLTNLGGIISRGANNLNTIGATGFHSGFLILDPSTTGAPTTDWQNTIKCFGPHWGYGGEYSFELSHPFFADDLYVRRTVTGSPVAWRKILTNSNAQAANGSAASPTFSFESDVNTGMYSVGVDALGFSTGGVNRLTIDNVGAAVFTGLIVGRPTGGTNVNTNNDTGSFSVRSDASNAASMSFHRTGAFAINMGVGTDNVFRIGGWSASNDCLQLSATGNLTALGNVTAYSDERLKTNIETLDPLKVFEMRGVSFVKDGKAGSGVVAQEMQKVAPELVHDELEYLSVAYGNTVGYLIEGAKWLKESLKKAEEKVEILEEIVAELRRDIQALKKVS